MPKIKLPENEEYEVGEQPAVIAECLEKGRETNQFGKKQWTWFYVLVLEEQRDDGTPKEIDCRFNCAPSTYKKPSRMLTLLTDLRGKQFTTEELHEGIDPEEEVGKPCRVIIKKKQKQSGDGEYFMVDGLLPPKSKGKKIGIPDDYISWRDREDKQWIWNTATNNAKKSDEFSGEEKGAVPF